MTPEKPNPMRDSWKPEEKAAEAKVDNPAEFPERETPVEKASGPVPSGRRRTHGEDEASQKK